MGILLIFIVVVISTCRSYNRRGEARSCISRSCGGNCHGDSTDLYCCSALCWIQVSCNTGQPHYNALIGGPWKQTVLYVNRVTTRSFTTDKVIAK